jgi:hypothetical protein
LLVAVISQQTSLPSDTVFGRWMSPIGWAGSLVVLTFSGTWVLPLLTSLSPATSSPGRIARDLATPGFAPLLRASGNSKR